VETVEFVDEFITQKLPTSHPILNMVRHPVVHMAPHMVFQMEPHTTLHMVLLCEMKSVHPVMDVLSISLSLQTLLTVTVNRSRDKIRVFHYYLFFHHAHTIFSSLSHIRRHVITNM
jgi:hypothetical protein